LHCQAQMGLALLLFLLSMLLLGLLLLGNMGTVISDQ
jgi:Tfp pilus assembly protein PilX